MSVKERIQEYLKYIKVSPTAAEKKLGWGVGAFTKAKSITADRAADFLAYFPDLSAEWLLRGDGPMIRQPLPSATETERLGALVDTIALLQETIAEKNKTIAILETTIERYEKSLVR
ncbi:MAG: hypothetical protein LUC85_02390 [Bacteroidales bacterium]|nr:hypothetical protein [Bacteroidales bacterium]MCD8393667.1 hypothetical protein [Bacteroidales bacterium]